MPLCTGPMFVCVHLALSQLRLHQAVPNALQEATQHMEAQTALCQHRNAPLGTTVHLMEPSQNALQARHPRQGPQHPHIVELLSVDTLPSLQVSAQVALWSLAGPHAKQLLLLWAGLALWRGVSH